MFMGYWFILSNFEVVELDDNGIVVKFSQWEGYVIDFYVCMFNCDSILYVGGINIDWQVIDFLLINSDFFMLCVML